MLIGIDANEANLTRRVGVNYYAFNLLHALYHLKTDHQFAIYLKLPPFSDLPPTKSNWTYRVIPFPKLWTQTRLPFDLYTQYPRPDIFFSLTHYAPRFCPVPSVISIMDLGYLLFPDQFTKKDLHQLRSWTSYSIKQAAKIIAISQNTKRDIIKYFNRKPEDIIVTYLAHDSTIFKPTRKPEVLIKYGIKKPYLLFLSSLKPSKNVEGLVNAFSQLDLPDYQLVISGKKAWMYESIFSLVNRLELKDRVIFTDYVPASDNPVLMSMAEVFVLPSFYEGFALPALEAMACGTPTVVSQVANLPEVVGQAVVYIDPNRVESIKKGILQAIKDRSRLSRLGIKQAARFSWSNTARQTLAVLESAK